MKRHAALIAMTGVLLALAGCKAGGGAAASAYVSELSQLRYPADAQRGPDLDIVVVRRGPAIELVNLTSESHGNVQLWINREYVGLVDAVRIGRPASNRVPLARFVNRHREIFPTGTFLVPDKRVDVIVAELYDPASSLRHRVRVQRGGS